MNFCSGFDYRPFVLNWCMTVKCIDGFMVNPIESLKAEWLYSQGRGRQFRIGEQAALSRYLSSVCPLSGEVLENENERKLRLILSKAQQHQRQLQEEISGNQINHFNKISFENVCIPAKTKENANTSGSNSPSSARRKGQSSKIQSPRCKFYFYKNRYNQTRCIIELTRPLHFLPFIWCALVSRLGRQGSPDSMSSSYHGNTSNCSLLSSTQHGDSGMSYCDFSHTKKNTQIIN